MSGYIGKARSVNFAKVDLPIRDGNTNIIEQDGSYYLQEGAGIKDQNGNTIISSDGTIAGVDFTPINSQITSIQNQINTIEEDNTSLDTSIGMVEDSIGVVEDSIDAVVPTSSYTFRNKLINGDMRIWQRSEDNENTTNAWGFYTADRWFTNKGRVRLVSETLDGVSISAMEISPSSGTYNGGRGVLQKIEDKSVCEKQTVFSAYVKASTNSTVEFGRIHDKGSSSSTPGININVTTTFQRFYVINPIVSTTDHLQHYIISGLEDGVTYTIANAQLEEGTVPTPFELRPYGIELALCKRYFQEKILSSRTIGGSQNGYVRWRFDFENEMRSAPSMSINGTYADTYAPNGNQITVWGVGASSRHLPSLLSIGGDKQSFQLILNVANSGTGNFYELGCNDGSTNTNPPSALADAEL